MKKLLLKSLIFCSCILGVLNFSGCSDLESDTTNSNASSYQEIQRVQQQIDEQTELNQEYQEMIDQSMDDEYIQKLTREELGLAYPDERVYIDMGG